jgi:hypothetical protein
MMTKAEVLNLMHSDMALWDQTDTEELGNNSVMLQYSIPAEQQTL